MLCTFRELAVIRHLRMIHLRKLAGHVKNFTLMATGHLSHVLAPCKKRVIFDPYAADG